MNLNATTVLLALAPPAREGQEPQPFWVTMVPLLLMVVIFYLLLFRPQQKKAKDHAALLKTIKPGDKIVTSSGIVAVVVAVKDKTVSIRSADTKLEILKSAVAEISERSGESGQS